MPKTCAIVPAAGSGVRMGAPKPKQLLEIRGRPILIHTLDALAAVSFLAEIFLVVPENFMDEIKSLVQAFRVRQGRRVNCRLVKGGKERQDSVFNALQELPPECEWVCVHDGVRPFVTPALMESTLRAALQCGAAVAAVPASDTVKRVNDGWVTETLPRHEVWLVQTPQVFRRDLLERAYRDAREKGRVGTDDASLVESLGLPVAVVAGEPSNIKVTAPEDLVWAEWFLSRRAEIQRSAAGMESG